MTGLPVSRRQRSQSCETSRPNDSRASGPFRRLRRVSASSNRLRKRLTGAQTAMKGSAELSAGSGPADPASMRHPRPWSCRGSKAAAQLCRQRHKPLQSGWLHRSFRREPTQSLAGLGIPGGAMPRISTRFTNPRGACPPSALDCNINNSSAPSGGNWSKTLSATNRVGISGRAPNSRSGIRIPCSGSNSALKFPARLRREFCKKTMQYQRISHTPFA